MSSLGGIGGTAFTPIINAPEVAILGLSRLAHKPVYGDGAFVPRLMLPLSLSYDHRVIDGALAARFITYLSTILGRHAPRPALKRPAARLREGDRRIEQSRSRRHQALENAIRELEFATQEHRHVGDQAMRLREHIEKLAHG